jgi:phage shock protein A
MSIFRRVRDIVTANLHEMVDKFEYPDVMLRQAIREMEEAIARSLDRAASVVASAKMLERQEPEQGTAIARWEKRAQSALDRGDETEARDALVEKRRSAQLRDALQSERESLHATSEKLKRRIAAMRVRLAEARRLELALSARLQASRATENLGACCGADESGFARFERMRFHVERAEAQAEARREFFDNDISTSFSAEVDFEEAAEVEAELAAMKERVQRAARSKVGARTNNAT